MFSTSLAVLALAAAIPPFGSLVHMHPHAASDSRLTLTLVNASERLCDVRIDGRMYEMLAHQRLTVKGPEGTAVYAESPTYLHRRGDVLASLTSQSNGGVIRFQ